MRTETQTVDMEVKGGFPVTVEIERSEDEGGEYEYEITDIRTRAGRSAGFLLKSMSPNQKDDMLDRAIDSAFY